MAKNIWRLKQYINSLKSKKKKVIFIDEVAWFDTTKSVFLPALDNFWNSFCTKRNDIVLIICGSAASWIINKVINDKGGLHNRVTRTIQLMPFTLAETEEYIIKILGCKLEQKDIVTLYMCLGGVPFYFKDIKPGESTTQILNKLCFKKNAPLRKEYANLYPALFTHYERHEQIVAALAKNNKGLTRHQLAQKTKITSGGGLTKVLEELIQCGFVTQTFPYGKIKTDSLYRLIDEFSIFHHKFIPKNNEILNWAVVENSQSFKIWCGFAFETVCMKHIKLIKNALGIAGVVSNEYSWVTKASPYTNAAQIDLLIDRGDNCINICEIKFYDEPFLLQKKEADNLKNKKAAFKYTAKTRKNIFITLVTPYGYIKNSYALEVIANGLELPILFKK